MIRRAAVWVGALVVAMSTVSPAPVASAAPAVAAPAGPTAKASITFDVDTGKVIDAGNAREPVGVASTIKLLTALIVEANVPMDDEVPITRQAADVSPLKLTMEPGSHWRAGDLLHAMLIASLNDTAMALAIEAGGGSMAGFHRQVAAEARLLGLADHPKVQDPTGLDGPDSVGGGNLISARDLAIVTRAFLSNPALAAIVEMPSYHFTGGDGRPHVVYNHNAFLNIYPGAIGVKTGYTDRTGHSLVAAATRDGRTLATVVIGSPDPVGFATAHLDAAFAAGPDTPGTGDVLPEPAPPTTVPPTTATTAPLHLPAQMSPVETSGSGPWFIGAAAVLVLCVAATLAIGVRRRGRTGAPRPRSDRS